MQLVTPRLLVTSALLMMATVSVRSIQAQNSRPVNLNPTEMQKIATIDPRYLSYNIEMVEVTGGRFWAPYRPTGASALNPALDANHQVGGNSSLYQYRAPINLSNPRLRKLAQALAPSYVRVSGTWQNSTYFQNDDKPAAQVPEGFKSVLTRAQWKGVLDFSHAVDAKIVTSVAISPGTRDASGVWTPAQAKALFDYTRSIGGSIAATEFMNEPTFPGPGGAPKGYDATAFGRDAKLFGAFVRKESPKTIYLGPGSVGEGAPLGPAGMHIQLLSSEDLLKASGPIFDAFSYHFYGGVSRRCGGGLNTDQALTANWLDRTEKVEEFYASLRDQYDPGKPMWLTETAEAACGGDQIAGQFADTFRFLNQLGTLAQKGVKVVMHNTLAASDYGLLSEDNLEPRPDYWAAVLWKRTMGSTVLKPNVPTDASLRVYAQCMKDVKGGVALLVLNTDSNQKRSITLPAAADSYTLTSKSLSATTALLNGAELHANSDGSLPAMTAHKIKAGEIELDPLSLTFLTFSSAKNKSCM